MPDAAPILSALGERAQTTRDREELGRVAVESISKALAKANWVGIYWLEGDTLVLGPYIGAPTEHVRIPVGSGVCGTAVSEDADQVVDDVTKRANYLACSAGTRSEIVVLIRACGKVVGQFDLDSDEPGAFTGDDHCFLAMAAAALASLIS